MTKNYACRTPYLSKHTHTSFDCVFCCTSCCKMMASPDVFFFNFSKFWFSGLSQELYLIWLRFLVHISKMISPTIFHFFKIQIFQVFQNSSINAKRKLWGVDHLFHKCVIFYLSLMIQIVVLILVSCIYYSFFFLSFLLLIFGIFKYADLLKIMF